MLEVRILTSEGALFEGPAERVSLPGEQGIFEVGPFHRTLMSRLLPGTIGVDGRQIPILRGVVKVQSDRVVALVEAESGFGNSKQS